MQTDTLNRVPLLTHGNTPRNCASGAGEIIEASGSEIVDYFDNGKFEAVVRYQIGWQVRAMNSERFRAFDRDSLLKFTIFVTSGVSTSLAWSLTRTSCVSEVTQTRSFFC